MNENKTKHSTFYSNSWAEIIIHDADIDIIFESVYNKIIITIQICQVERWHVTIDLLKEHH